MNQNFEHVVSMTSYVQEFYVIGDPKLQFAYFTENGLETRISLHS